MTVFNSYAYYYDLLYKDKDYDAEARFISGLLAHHVSGAKEVLELGCGTGAHAAILAKTGLTVHGVDLSSDMLALANKRKASLSPEIADRLAFDQGDVRTVRIGKKFDAVISLFHVMSYQPENHDIRAALLTAKEHLRPGGVFIFDCWYGPAVLSDPPVVRVKKMEDEFVSITRIAEPVMYPNDNLVDVSYKVFVKDKMSGNVEELNETHRMRYFFKPEIELLFSEADFEIAACGEWMTGLDPSCETWGVYFIGRLQ